MRFTDGDVDALAVVVKAEATIEDSPDRYDRRSGMKHSLSQAVTNEI